MSFARTVRTLTLAGLIAALAGCSRPPVPTPPAKSAPTVKQAGNASELLVGKWELVRDDSANAIDWSFIDDKLNGKDVVLKIGDDGNLSVQPAGTETGPEAAYVFADETLEIRAPEKLPKEGANNARPNYRPQRLRAIVNDRELVLNDTQNNVLKFRRAAGLPGAVKISGLPMCCGGCSIALKNELVKVPGLSELNIDVKRKSATLKLTDAEQLPRVTNAIRKAGMHGLLELNGKAVGPTFNVLGSVKGDNELVLNGVHACCGGCEKNFTDAVNVKDAKIDFAGEGSVKIITIKADKLDIKKVIADLGKAGFHVKLEELPAPPKEEKKE